MPPTKSNPIKVITQPVVTNVKKKKYFFKTSMNVNLIKPQTKEQLVTKRSKNFARLPAKPDEASSNWKTLSMQIKPLQSKGRLLYLERKKKEAAIKKETETSEGIATRDKTCNVLDVWFDDVDPILLGNQSASVPNTVQIGSNGKSAE